MDPKEKVGTVVDAVAAAVDGGPKLKMPALGAVEEVVVIGATLVLAPNEKRELATGAAVELDVEITDVVGVVPKAFGADELVAAEVTAGPNKEGVGLAKPNADVFRAGLKRDAEGVEVAGPKLNVDETAVGWKGLVGGCCSSVDREVGPLEKLNCEGVSVGTDGFANDNAAVLGSGDPKGTVDVEVATTAGVETVGMTPNPEGSTFFPRMSITLPVDRVVGGLMLLLSPKLNIEFGLEEVVVVKEPAPIVEDAGILKNEDPAVLDSVFLVDSNANVAGVICFSVSSAAFAVSACVPKLELLVLSG